MVERIGSGSYGEVWKAEQTTPVSRAVAIKILHLIPNRPALAASFLAEQQVLALLDHPGIAKVYDAGDAPSGQPYFVMHFVDGDTLLAYCDRECLTLVQRLDLFAAVCDAVHHAHQKGIIHRDLKPANIVVSTALGRAQPVVVDFGVAKVLAQSAADEASCSVLGQPQGTWEYMSPEQAEGSADIDVRSDVYSLGVVLYELLSGVRPFDDQLRGASYEARRRIILETQPPSPGAKLAADTTGVARVLAVARQVGVDELARTLRGELGWIPLYAMRKDRELRYRSVSELADDVRGYIDGRPLIAGPESARYRVAKFLRRNGFLAGSAAIVVSLFAALVAVAAQQRRIALEQAERADANAHKVDDAGRKIEHVAYVTSVQRAAEAMEDRRFERARKRLNESGRMSMKGWEWWWISTNIDAGLAAPGNAVHDVPPERVGPDAAVVPNESLDQTRGWDRSCGEPLCIAPGHLGRIMSVSLGAECIRMLIASAEAPPLVWDAINGTAIAKLGGLEGQLLCAAFSPDGERIVTSSAEGEVQIWDAATGAKLAELPDLAERTSSSTSRGVRTGSMSTPTDGTADPWADAYVSTRTHVVIAAALSTDNARAVTASWDKSARVWDMETGRVVCELNGHTGSVLSATFSHDGTRILTASTDRTARIWDAETGALLHELSNHSSRLTSAAFSMSGKMVVTASADETACIWSAATGTCLAALEGHAGEVASASFSPDGRRVVTASSDGTARVWDAETGLSLVTLNGRDGGLVSAMFSPDGTRIVTFSADGSARMWDCLPASVRSAGR